MILFANPNVQKIGNVSQDRDVKMVHANLAVRKMLTVKKEKNALIRIAYSRVSLMGTV